MLPLSASFEKDNSPLFSVIMPVYNAATWLRQSVGSVLKQTFSDWELICIDDGSTDESAEALKEYAKKDSRIRYIWQSNSGVSSARNNGLKRATGKFILFIDADDYFDNDALSIIGNVVESTTTEFAVMQIREVRPLSYDCESLSPDRNGSIRCESFSKDNLSGCSWYVTDKVYKRDIIENHNIQFEPDIHMCEDFYFWFRYAAHCSHVVFIDDVLYNHQLSPGSLSNTWINKIKNKEEKVKKQFTIPESLAQCCDCIEDVCIRKTFRAFLLYRSIYFYFFMYKSLRRIEPQQRKVYKRFLKLPISKLKKEVPFRTVVSALWYGVTLILNQACSYIRRRVLRSKSVLS